VGPEIKSVSCASCRLDANISCLISFPAFDSILHKPH